MFFVSNSKLHIVQANRCNIMNKILPTFFFSSSNTYLAYLSEGILDTTKYVRRSCDYIGIAVRRPALFSI